MEFQIKDLKTENLNLKIKLQSALKELENSESQLNEYVTLRVDYDDKIKEIQ